jgi:drug/metabolite transporter (DMT)-like permease
VHAVATFATVLATVSKHHVAGIVGIIVGALLVVVGGIRVAMRATRAIAVPIVGLVIVVGSILVYAKVY